MSQAGVGHSQGVAHSGTSHSGAARPEPSASRANGHGHGHGSDHHGDHDEHDVHVSMSGYVTGFVLSVILTAIPFWLIMNDVIKDSSLAAIAVLAIGGVQIVVHMVYFLHLNTRLEHGWSLLSLIFTMVLLGIALSGSLWIMHHLHQNMNMSSSMPTSAEMRQQP